jgi:hypothetical protein
VRKSEPGCRSLICHVYVRGEAYLAAGVPIRTRASRVEAGPNRPRGPSVHYFAATQVRSMRIASWTPASLAALDVSVEWKTSPKPASHAERTTRRLP